MIQTERKKFLILCALLVFGTMAAAGAAVPLYEYCAKTGIVNAVSPWYCQKGAQSINQALISNWTKWEPLAFLAVLLSFFIAILIFVMGTVLRNERLRTFGIGEMYEALASAIIVIMFLTIAGIIFGLLPSFVLSGNPYTSSLTYISNTINAEQNSVYQLFRVIIAVRFYTSIRTEICLPLCIRPITEPLAYLATWYFYTPAWAIVDLQLDGIMLLYGEFYLILLFSYMAIPVFLIPGVIFRTVLPTRGLGGIMIAVAIGFYFVMPVLFSFAEISTAPKLMQQAVIASSELQQYGGTSGAIFGAASPSSNLVTKGLDGIQASMGDYWLSVLFYPALILGVTYLIIGQIAEFIGGMTQLSGRMRAFAV